MNTQLDNELKTCFDQTAAQNPELHSHQQITPWQTCHRRILLLIAVLEKTITDSLETKTSATEINQARKDARSGIQLVDSILRYDVLTGLYFMQQCAGTRAKQEAKRTCS